jgi:undecaprenyl-phosphate galactose phosphotransferase/putative colanic acid biosynthesis UDP-glucose lipid carrier transferase
MRRTNIDELPQFFNVLWGTMSVIGPRPHMLKHTEVYSNWSGTTLCKLNFRLGPGKRFSEETKELSEMKDRVILTFGTSKLDLLS